jgi:hypothetical protein
MLAALHQHEGDPSGEGLHLGEEEMGEGSGCVMGRLQVLGEEGEGGGRWPKGGQEGRGGGGCKTKEGGGGSARVGGKRVGSHPSDRDQWPRPALTSVLPTPA